MDMIKKFFLCISIIFCFFLNISYANVLSEEELLNPERVLHEEIVQRARYSDADVKPGTNKKFYWINVKNMKPDFTNNGVDPKIFNWNFQKNIGKIFLANPEFGKIITQNTRDSVIVSNLSQEDFEREVFLPLKEKTAIELKNKLTAPKGYSNWKEWIRINVSLGGGDTVDDAFLANKINSSLDEWKKSAMKLRDELVVYFGQKSIDFSQMIVLNRCNDCNSNLLSKIYSEKNVSSEMQEKMKHYSKMLYVADYWPLTKPLEKKLANALLLKKRKLPSQEIEEIYKTVLFKQENENWRINYVFFVKNSLHSRFVIGIDLIGIGNINRIEYDKWIQKNGSLQELKKLHSVGTHRIIKNKREVSEFLGSLKNKPISRFDFGDATYWSFENLSDSEMNKIKSELEKNTSIRFKVKKIDIPLENRKLTDIENFISDFTVS